MTPKQLHDINVGDRLHDLGNGRIMTVIYDHEYDEGDALLIAVPNPDQFSVIVGDDSPVPKGQYLVKEYIGSVRLKIVTNDPQAIHQANVAIISAIDAHRWEVVQ